MDDANQAPAHRTPAHRSDAASVGIGLHAEPASAGVARAFVAEHWHDLDAAILADVTLIVSELVTNAVRHGLPEIMLTLRRAPSVGEVTELDIAVLDHGLGAPQQRATEDTGTSGRGLAIVNHLSSRWGCDMLHDGTGKTVWASVQHR